MGNEVPSTKAVFQSARCQRCVMPVNPGGLGFQETFIPKSYRVRQLLNYNASCTRWGGLASTVGIR